MNSALSYEATSQILGSVRIPSAPAVFMELHELMQVDEPDLEKVSAVIMRDPGLAALVLKTVNSPFFGLRVQVRSLRQAITLLGLLNIGNIVAGVALRKAMEASDAPSPEHYWDSPVNVGMVATKLAQQVPMVQPDEAYMLGLFHNVGIPLMMQRFPDYLATIDVGVVRGPEIVEAEDAHYQTNHAVIGYFVSQSWCLPGHIGELILRHHDVEEVFAENGGAMTPKGAMLAVLWMATQIDHLYWGRADDPEWEVLGHRVISYVGLSSTDFDDLAEDMVELLSDA